MNMGIEQYVYELLGKPDVEIAGPVSYGLCTHAGIDWINVDAADGKPGASAPLDEKLVLLGGCDLLQLASYCSTNRLEFVNGEKEGYKIRFDDPGFILADRSALKVNPVIGQFPWWTHEDAIRFDEGIAAAGLLLVSLWSGMNGHYYQIGDGIRIRLTGRAAGDIKENFPDLFDANFESLDLGDEERLRMIGASFDSIAARCQRGAQIFVLGCYTRGLPGARNRRRVAYNKACRDYCESHGEAFRYVDPDSIVSPEALVNETHFSRVGYFELAQFILDAASRSPRDRNKARRRARIRAHQERRERARAQRLAEQNSEAQGGAGSTVAEAAGPAPLGT
jgi:hypothetical protein